ncbi:hypothetical protein MPSEU_000245400 [Mayamaea pseudoterrestris]|nr:hypothetical protein MPSEU_000245400 [Mayamaea pseudoterrestris]
MGIVASASVKSSIVLVALCSVCTETTFGFQLGTRRRSKFASRGFPSTVLLSSSASAADGSQQISPTKFPIRNATYWESAIRGPPRETKPDYENIVGPLGRKIDKLFLTVFRKALAEHTQLNSTYATDDFRGITDIALKMNRKYPNRTIVQQKALDVLKSLFPFWLPSAYARLFASPFPKFSARMNAWATKVAGTWLMGECEINDVVAAGPDGEDAVIVGPNQGLLVKRCRFLEESGCASVCVNSCKIPTQAFFAQEMGLPLTMEPNYETFECQFSFGKVPNEADELEAKNVPCLMRCPTAGSIRKQHSATTPMQVPKETSTITDTILSRPCDLMENTSK